MANVVVQITKVQFEGNKEATSYVVRRLTREGSCGSNSLRAAIETAKSEFVDIANAGNNPVLSFRPELVIEQMPRGLRTRIHHKLTEAEKEQVLLRLDIDTYGE